jgi:hypothetical protein
MNSQRSRTLKTPRINRWVNRRLNPDFDNPKTASVPAMIILSAAGASSCAVLLLYHLSALNFLGLQVLMRQMGKIFLPGSQGISPVQGYLGSDAGIFVAYFLIFAGWWILGLQAPFLTLDRLPHFVAVVHILHIILAWQLFFPWLTVG